MLRHAHIAALACCIEPERERHSCCPRLSPGCDTRRSNQAPGRQPAEATCCPLLPRPDDPACRCYRWICSQGLSPWLLMLAAEGRAATPVAMPRYVTVLRSATYAIRCAPARLSGAGSGAHKQHQAHRLQGAIALSSGVLACPPCSQIRPYLNLHATRVDDVQPRYRCSALPNAKTTGGKHDQTFSEHSLRCRPAGLCWHRCVVLPTCSDIRLEQCHRHAQGLPDDQGLPPVAEPLSPAHELMLPPPDAGCRSVLADAAAKCWFPPALTAPAGVLTLRWRQGAAAPAPPHWKPTQRTAPAAAPGPPPRPPAPGVNCIGRDVDCVCVSSICHGTEQLLQSPIMPSSQAGCGHDPCLIRFSAQSCLLSTSSSSYAAHVHEVHAASGDATSIAALPSRPAAARAPSCCHSSSASHCVCVCPGTAPGPRCKAAFRHVANAAVDRKADAFTLLHAGRFEN